MDGIILSYTRGQVNANGSRREVHAAQEVLEAGVGTERCTQFCQASLLTGPKSGGPLHFG